MIHYHGLPITGEGTPVLAMQGKHCMVSFAHPSQLEIAAELCQSFALDNGAFSAWKQGKRIDLGAFYEWAHLWARHPGCDWILAPDVIDGTEQQNDDLLLPYSDSPHLFVPVWHLHESVERLSTLIVNFPRVAIGSSGEYAQVGTAAWWNRMAQAMEVATDDDGRPFCKLHGLRMLDPTVFSHFPFSSADSTNVARNVGIDSAWKGPYAPRSRSMRAQIMMERIEAHASACRWSSSAGKNYELFG